MILNGIEIHDGDLVLLKCRASKCYRAGLHAGFFYHANLANAALADFLLATFRREDWGFWDGYGRGFRGEHIVWIKLLQKSEELAK